MKATRLVAMVLAVGLGPIAIPSVASAETCTPADTTVVIPSGFESQFQALVGAHARGTALPTGWTLDSIGLWPHHAKYLFRREGRTFSLHLLWPRALDVPRSRNFRLCFEDPKGQLAGPDGRRTRDYLIALIRTNDRESSPWRQLKQWDDRRSQQPTGVVLLGLLAVALLLGLFAGRTVLASARRVHARDWLLLGSLGFFGAALRVWGGIRTPAWVNFHGNELLTKMLAQPDILLWEHDRHGNTFYAVHGLALSILPKSLDTIMGVQLALSLATIPLTFSVARLWFRDVRAARWSAAVLAVLPTPVYFGLTEARMVPGAFFLMLTLTVLGLAVRTSHPLLMFAAALLAVVTSQCYPTLLVMPLVVLLFVVSQPEGRKLLRGRWIWVAGAVGLALWTVPAWRVLQTLMHGAKDSVYGAGFFQSLDLQATFVPVSGFSSATRGNVFLNPSYTPPLFSVASAAGILWGGYTKALRWPALAAWGLAALLTAINMMSGNMDGARTQLVAQPLCALLAGLGLSWAGTTLTSWLRGSEFLWTGGLMAIFAASLALWPGPIGRLFTPQHEARAFAEGVPRLPARCVVFAPSHVGRFPNSVAAYHLLSRKDLQYVRMERDEFTPWLRQQRCLVYFRTTACFDRSHVAEEHKAPVTPDGRILPCAGFESALGLTPLFVKEIPARPDCRQLFTRQRLPVGFFRVTRLPPPRTTPSPERARP